MNTLCYIFMFLLGTILGSYYGVLGIRIPRGENTFNSRSHCEKCGHILKWYELIPVLSFFFQKGKCRVCKTKLSIMYPLLELGTGLLFLVSYHSYGFSYNLIISLTLISLFMLVIVSDINYLIIPDRFIIVSSIIIFLAKLLDVGILQALIQVGYGILCFGFMYLIMILGNYLFKKESLGGADIKLMFLVGLTLDPMLAIVVLFLSSIIALPISLIILVKNKEHVIPYGPFIMLGLLIVNFTKLNIKEIFLKFINLLN